MGFEEAGIRILRAMRNDFPYVIVDASVDYSDSALVCFDLSELICLITSLDVVGVKGPAILLTYLGCIVISLDNCHSP